LCSWFGFGWNRGIEEPHGENSYTHDDFTRNGQQYDLIFCKDLIYIKELLETGKVIITVSPNNWFALSSPGIIA
jgi:hypothetical protein